MTSRERIRKTINHVQPDKLPIDFGGWLGTGINVSVVYQLRQKLGLDKPLTPVKVIEPFQMLGEIKDDLKKIIGIDIASLVGSKNFFGFENNDWKEWKLWDGTPVMVPEMFNTKEEKNGSIFMYAEGDQSYPPAAKMPYRGYYFDLITRQDKIYENNLNVEDNLEEFNIISDSELDYLNKQALNLYSNSEYSIFGSLLQTSFGDVALVPGPTLKNPKGIRDLTEWYISLVVRKEYVKKIFSRQCDIALENCKIINQSFGKLIDVMFVTGTDFGSQKSTFISEDLYKELFKPVHKKINDWIHENTNWKTFMHCCGSIEPLIKEFIDAGFDILNPVQISAAGMDPALLKKKYGKYITFWGGGVDTQKTLPFGTTQQVREEVKKLIDIFFVNGGFVFNTVHNIQANTPVENIIAMIDVLKKYR
ncbi:MAG: methyltransferase [Actinobacteria bacterium]|nr:methyltransferase [Actinomycetota bacterium]